MMTGAGDSKGAETKSMGGEGATSTGTLFVFQDGTFSTQKNGQSKIAEIKVEDSAKKKLSDALGQNKHRSELARVMNNAWPEEGLIQFFNEKMKPLLNIPSLTVEKLDVWVQANSKEFIITESGHLQPSLCAVLDLDDTARNQLEEVIKSLYVKGVSLVSKEDGQLRDWLWKFFHYDDPEKKKIRNLLQEACAKFSSPDEKSEITASAIAEVRCRLEAGAMFYTGAMHSCSSSPKLAIFIGGIIGRINKDYDELSRALESANISLDKNVDEEFTKIAKKLLEEGNQARLNVINRSKGVAKITKQLKFVDAVNKFVEICKKVDKEQRFSKKIIESMIEQAKERLRKEVFDDIFAKELKRSKALFENLAALRQAALDNNSKEEEKMVHNPLAYDTYQSGLKLANELLAKPTSREKNQELKLLAETIHHCAEISKKNPKDFRGSLKVLEKNVNKIAGKPNRWKQFLGAVCMLAGAAAIALGGIFAPITGGTSIIAGALGGVSLISVGYSLFRANRRVGFSKNVADLANSGSGLKYSPSTDLP